MANFTALKLAAALAGCAMLMPWNNAEACSTAAWTETTGAPIAGDPRSATPVLRYAGQCGLRAANPGPSFVTESTNHDAEGGATPYRARFFIYTGVNGANPVVFRARDAANNALVAVAYNSTDQNFAFTVNGSTQSTAAGSAPRNRWIQVEMTYRAGQPFAASTRHLDAVTNLAAGLTAGAGTINSVNLGIIANGGGTGTVQFDEFEASRSTDMAVRPFAPTCRGDANGDGALNVFDVVGVRAEILGNALRTGQPDCNEDGAVNVFDAICVRSRILNNQTCG